MGLTNLMERIMHLQRQRQIDHVKTYRELVASIAAGSEPDALHVETTLNASGKTLADLEAAVRRCEQRNLWKAQLQQRSQLEKEGDRLQKELQAVDATLAAAEETHSTAVQPISAKLMEVRAKLSDASTASDQLLHTCDDPQLRAEQEAANAELSLLIRQRQELETQLSQLRNQAECGQQQLQEKRMSRWQAGFRAEVEKLQTQIDRGQKLLKVNERKLQEALASRDRIEQQMREA